MVTDAAVVDATVRPAMPGAVVGAVVVRARVRGGRGDERRHECKREGEQQVDRARPWACERGRA
jgi:hypothetical protein